jgi:hypothetical protein
MLATPPSDDDGKTFYRDRQRVLRRAATIRDAGFGWLAVNATAIFSAGARSVGAISDELHHLHAALRAELG